MNADEVAAPVLPFSAFVDQELLKLALLAVAVNPAIGGVLIRGEKGSGKSVIVRALADILPPIEVVADCPFRCDPNDITNMCPSCRERYERGEKLPTKLVKMKIVNLPIGATEEMVVGTIDIEKVLREGIRAFQPGILARANRNILYIDEINLLPDHIADLILDAAAMGWNYVERENVSISHPARFILIGTMNPEEGDLRPQLLDRLPICVDVSGIKDAKLRVEVTKRNIEFSQDPLSFLEKYKDKQQKLRMSIENGRKLVKSVEIPEHLMYLVANLCTELEVDGHRPDIVIIQVARALAALEGRTVLDPNDIRIAAYMALIHRTRKGGLLEPPSLEEIHEAFLKSLKRVKTKFKIRVEFKERRAAEYLDSIMKKPLVFEKKQKVAPKPSQFFRREAGNRRDTEIPAKEV